MKRRFLLGVFTCALTLTAVGCGAAERNERQASETTVQPDTEAMAAEEMVENRTTADSQEDQSATENQNTEQTESTETPAVAQSGDVWTFETLSKYDFEFTSGAGGWSTEWMIEKDGTFSGLYHDSDMGDTGTDYPNGTYYESSFHGSLRDLRKLDDTCYETKLDHVDYEQEPGTEEILDGVRHIYTEWYGPDGTDTYKIYLPGASIADFSDDLKFWISYANDGEDILKNPIIVNEEKEQAFYSYPRLSPYEDAVQQIDLMNTAIAACDEELQDAQSTMEMREIMDSEYQNADYCLNYIWKLIKNNVDADRYQKILEEQRSWLKERDAAGEQAAEVNAGGTMAPLDQVTVLTEETVKRCGELGEYLK